MREPRAWVLNLDAEHELEGGPRYAPTRRLRSIVERESRRLLGTLVAPGDVVLSCDPEENAGLDARGLRGLAWSPTPRALRALCAAGAEPAAAPGVEVLRRVNARPFAAAVRAPLVRASFARAVARNLEEVLPLLERPAPLGWLVRRTFGTAGRGRRRIPAGRPDAVERAWLIASLRRGPLVVEPWVEILCEYTRSGWVRPDGAVIVSPPCFQAVSREGAWRRTEAAERGELAREDDRRLEEACARAGEALAAAGYHGAFGIDAFRHRTAAGASALNPLSEINARFTMDWTTGMTQRPERG